MKMAKVLLVLLSYLAFCGPVNAQSGIERVSTSPYEQQFVMEFSSGTTVVADYSTQRVYISAADGTQYDVTFEQAIAASEPDPAKRQQMLNELNASLTDMEHLATITAPRVATDTRYWPNPYWEWCGNVICIPSDDPHSFGESQTFGKRSVSTASCDTVWCPPEGFPCDNGPCRPNTWAGGNFFYSGFGAGWQDDQGGAPVTQQQFLAYDYNRWKSHQQGACEDALENAALTAGAIGATTASCFAFATGIGALGCGGGAIAVAIGIYQTNEAEQECHADYPGMGNW